MKKILGCVVKQTDKKLLLSEQDHSSACANAAERNSRRLTDIGAA